MNFFILTSLLLIFTFNACSSLNTLQVSTANGQDCSLSLVAIEKTTKIDSPKDACKILKLQSVKIVTFSSEQFEGLDDIPQINIDNSTGLFNLENFLFVRRLESIEVKNSDLEIVGEKPFLKLFRLATLKLTNNKIKTVNQRAFSDLAKVTEIDLSFNEIQWIHGDTFASCQQLRFLRLTSNLMTSVPPELVSRNQRLIELALADNKILAINKRDFSLPLTTLTTLDLRRNICVDANYVIKSSFMFQASKAFAICFMNHEVIHHMNGTIDKMLETNKRTVCDQTADVEKTTEITFKTFEESGSPIIDFRTTADDSFQEASSCWMISLTASLITITVVVIIMFITYRKIVVKVFNHVVQPMEIATLESKV